MSSFERLPDWGSEKGFTPDRGAGPHATFQPQSGGPAEAAATPEALSGTGAELPDENFEASPVGVDASLLSAIEALSGAARELVALRSDYLVAHRREAVELAFVIASAVLARSFAGDVEGLAARIERAVEHLDGDEPLRLQLAPTDHQIVESGATPALERIVSQAPIELVADPQLEPGEFRLEAGPAESDGRLDALLSRMREQLAGSVGGLRVSAATDTAFFERSRAAAAELDPFTPCGRVRSLVGDVLEVEGLRAPLGSVCRVQSQRGGSHFDAEVVGFRDDRFVLMPLAEPGALAPGARVHPLPSAANVGVAESWLGRVVDGLGRPLDGGPRPAVETEVPLYRASEPPLQRATIDRPLDLGVRAINGLVTVGRGARMGIFSGAGVGKSTLLGQIARNTNADVNVIALVGERGREVREFVENDLGASLANSVVVVATSDEAPLMRVRAAYVATAIAEYFRGHGRHVLLLMDSLTRFCTALREIGLAAGQPPATRGYPPSMWARLPKLLERAGNAPDAGSITGIYTVLMEGDDPNEPVADAARSLLDGHILLSRELAEQGQFPPIDPLASVSRVMERVVSERHARLAWQAREALATYRRAHDLISIGAYSEGSDVAIDRARRLHDPLRAFLSQRRDEVSDLAASEAALAGALGEEAST